MASTLYELEGFADDPMNFESDNNSHIGALCSFHYSYAYEPQQSNADYIQMELRPCSAVAMSDHGGLELGSSRAKAVWALQGSGCSLRAQGRDAGSDSSLVSQVTPLHLRQRDRPAEFQEMDEAVDLVLPAPAQGGASLRMRRRQHEQLPDKLDILDRKSEKRARFWEWLGHTAAEGSNEAPNSSKRSS